MLIFVVSVVVCEGLKPQDLGSWHCLHNIPPVAVLACFFTNSISCNLHIYSIGFQPLNSIPGFSIQCFQLIVLQYSKI